MKSLPIASVPPAGMPDTFGRVATDLRVSVTDRCNLRCSYCMPAEGLPWMPKPEMLTDDELLRIITVFIGLGVRQVRLTGGVPAEKQIALALFLASQRSNHISGKLIHVNDDWKRFEQENMKSELYTLRRVQRI